MRFTLYTIVDITETGARRGDQPKLLRQQQNFLTVLQTIGLRVNPTYIGPPEIIKKPRNIKFGKNYKKISKVWRWSFDIEYDDAINTEMLENDFNMIPFITKLDETVDFEIAAFDTKNSENMNIIFEVEINNSVTQ